ncbi:hypothetical protein Zmor_014351 [Zophobas morio]|uniref:Uncharacterized protein n=1 Tax=Zophobas morio TaxID=2755281 RepID=A0AA38IKM8_9CUCU|nr:hypothetical protein Zmor_014351 [Zophobas morio]
MKRSITDYFSILSVKAQKRECPGPSTSKVILNEIQIEDENKERHGTEEDVTLLSDVEIDEGDEEDDLESEDEVDVPEPTLPAPLPSTTFKAPGPADISQLVCDGPCQLHLKFFKKTKFGDRFRQFKDEW